MVRGDRRHEPSVVAEHRQEFRRDRGAAGRRSRDRARRGRRADGRQRGGQVHPRQDHRRAIFRRPRATIEMEGQAVHFHRPIDARHVGIEVVYQDLALADNLSAADNVFLGRELRKGTWPVRHPRQAGDDRPFGRAVRGAEVRDAAEGSRPQDVGRPAPGRRHRAHPPLERQARADGRADGGDLGAAGGRGAGLIKRMQAKGVAIILISHRMPDVFSVCDRVVVMRRGNQGRRQADQHNEPRGDHGPHHGSDPCRLRP